MNSALCADFVIDQSFRNGQLNRRSPTDDEENQFDIEEIDLS